MLPSRYTTPKLSKVVEMRRATVAVVVLLAAIPAVGCGTLVNQSEPGSYINHQGRMRPHRLYGGVRSDGEMLGEHVAKVARGEPTGSSHSLHERDPNTGEWVRRDLTPVPAKVIDATLITALFVVDLPLSFVGDTIFLPVDILVQLKRLTGNTPAAEKPHQKAPTTSEESSPLKGLSNNSFNQWQMTRHHEIPLHDPSSPHDPPRDKK